ncbi:hypothetical protein P6144_01705 [Sphingomonas sp. HITSZ_GF]|uniref:hypothetical protein n=1 Tax=Sphingomonas sp. HITSZ_GF TaxID=3037247 RepID=UPI00240DEFFE|nr:hypothetical protein [Sphingomonas sp. HITSZ_GF]MDG2532348.1 hypothetical protein [Sphingomonas sp. HITSZ_GF]
MLLAAIGWVVRAWTGLLVVASMALAPIPAGAAEVRRGPIGTALMPHSSFSMVPDELALKFRPMVNGPGWWERVVGVVKGVLPADVVELARFAIAHPEEAASVYGHAAAQDYPFFALIAAVKIARKASSSFTLKMCRTPVTLIGTVFGKAADTVSNGVGKQDTNAVLAAAQSYAEEAANAASQQAQEAINDQLKQTVPYFGEIDTICLFAFDTNLKAEKDLQMVFTATVNSLVAVYDALAGGDVVGAVQGLVTLGVGSGVACKLIDSALSDGLLGKVPGLSILATGVCSTLMAVLVAIAEAVIELAKDTLGWAYNTGKAIYCGAKELLGGSCPSPPPPNAINKGLDYCKPYGGILRMIYDVSKSPDKPYWVECNDGHIMQHAPGSPDWFTTRAAEDAKKAKAMAANKLEADKWVAAVKKAADTEYRPRCASGDPQCQTEINLALNKAISQFWIAFQKYPLDNPGWVADKTTAYPPLWFDIYAITEASRFRVLPERWHKEFVPFWSARCLDDKCRMGMKIVGLGISLSIKQRHEKTPKATYEQIAQPLYAEALKNAVSLIKESKARFAATNKAITADASDGWAQLAIGSWTPKCRDSQCVQEVKALAAEMSATAKTLQAQQPGSSSLNVQGQASKLYGPKFQKAVEDSVARENFKKFGGVQQPGTRPTPAPTGRPTPAPVVRGLPPRPAPSPSPSATPAPAPTPTVLRRLPARPAPTPSPSPTARP